MHIYGYPVALGVLAVAAGIAARLVHHKSGWLHRATMVLFVVGASLLALGVIPWQDALARLTASGTGIVVALVVGLFAAAGFVYEIAHKHKDRRLRSHLYAWVAGSASIALVAQSARLFAEAARSPGKTASALSQSVRSISTGHAAHATSTHQAVVIVAFAVAAGLGLLAFISKLTPAAKTPGRAAPRAITAGRPALPPPARKGG